MSLNTTLPPHSLDAEKSVLGSMLRENSCIGDVILQLRDQDFYAASHQQIFAVIVGLFDAGKPADLVTLGERLIQRGQFDDVGGGVYLAELWDAAPTAANVEYYTRIVRDRSIARNLIHAGTDIIRAAYNPTGPAEEMLESAEKRILEVSELGATGQTVEMGSAISDAFRRLDVRMQRGGDAAVETGFLDLDKILCGLQDGEMILLAARPSQGKTALGLSIARHAVCKLGLPVLFVSLEQSRTELAERLLCAAASVDSHRLRKGTLTGEEMDALSSAAETLQGNGRLHIDDHACQGMTRIGANARRLKARHGIRLLVIDYLQLIEPEDKKTARHEQLETISRRLKHLARELNIPVVALAQLNREVEGRQSRRPQLSDLKGSGALEQDADVVLLLHKERECGTTDLIEVIIAKQRNGPTGMATLAFSKPYVRFDNYAWQETPYDAAETVY